MAKDKQTERPPSPNQRGNEKKLRRKPAFSWAGALKHLRDQCTSVELQHKASDWMAGKD